MCAASCTWACVVLVTVGTGAACQHAGVQERVFPEGPAIQCVTRDVLATHTSPAHPSPCLHTHSFNPHPPTHTRMHNLPPPPHSRVPCTHVSGNCAPVRACTPHSPLPSPGASADLSHALTRRSTHSVQLETKFQHSQATVQRLAATCQESLMSFVSMMKQLKVFRQLPLRPPSTPPPPCHCHTPGHGPPSASP